MSSPRREITVRPARVAGGLAAMAVALVFINIVAQLSRYVLDLPAVYTLLDRFDLNGETNIPTLFTCLLLFSAAALMAAIAALTGRSGRPFARHWAALSAIFLYLVADEFTQIHEGIGKIVGRLMGASTVMGFYTWLIPFGLVVLVVGLSFMGFLLRQPAALRNQLILAAALYVGGAMGMELAAAWHASVASIDTFSHTLIYTVEELMEMSGIIVLIYALLLHLRELMAGAPLMVSFAPAPERGWAEERRGGAAAR